MIKLDVLAGILKVLILNIDILQTLYDSNIPFSVISGKLSRMGSHAEDCLRIIFTILKKNRELQKNSKDFVSFFETLEQKLYIVKDQKQETRIKVINSMIKEYINIQETNNDNDEKINETVPELPNNLTINNNQSQIINKHREDDIETNSDEINTHSDSQELDISDSELEAIHRMDEILLNSKNDYANQSQPIENYIDVYLEDGDLAKNSDEINTHSDSQELAANISNSVPTTNEILNSMLAIDDNDIKIELELDNWMTNQFGNQSQIDDIKNSSNEINTSDPELDDILELVLDMYDTGINKIVTEAANISTVNNQSQPIESYQENNIENLQIIRQTHTEEVMQSVKKRKSCYDEHKDHSYARKRQCNNPELNSDHGTEVALNEQDSINVDCSTFCTISHLVGESICILSSDTAGYSASILE
ncbi:hypothetical protein [Orientia tsutsugamushi]|uniref:hypothetical protein n=1 Tax=Orientia tsutsugamushi TaxID=784 RepID=UPI004046E4B8